MYRGQESNAELDDIWQKYRGTLQSQQMQMAKESDSLVGVTIKVEKEACSLKNTHLHHLVMNLYMEDMIRSQLDLIWENYIVSAYNSNYSQDLWNISGNNCRFITKVAAATYEHSIALCKTSVSDIGFDSTLYDIFTDSQVKERIWNQNIPGAMKINDLWRKRKANAQLGIEEKRKKKTLIINKYGDLPHYFMETNIDFIPFTKIETKDQVRFAKPCEKVEASSEKNTSMSMILSAPETYCNVKPGSKTSDDGCYFGSAVKSLVISSSSLGVAEEVFSSTFIPQADSSVDYKMLCESLPQKGHSKVLADSDESFCLTNNSDSNINLHVRLSAHPCILTTDVILIDVNCTEPGERKGQNCFKWTAREKRMIQDEKLKSSQKNKSLLPCIVKKNHHCGKSFLPREKTFSTRLDINFAILAASLLGTTKDDFLFFPNPVFQSTSSSQMTEESFASRHEGLQYEQAEVEVSLGSEHINISTRRAHLECKTALNKQDFCFPSHFQSGVDTKQSEKETSGNNIDFYVESTCSNQVSCTEQFQKICLEKCLVEPESHNMTYCSFRNEMLLYKSRSRPDNMTTMEENHSGCISECQIIETKHKYQSCTKQNKNKERNAVQTGNVNSDAAQHNIECEEEADEVDMTFNNLDGMEEENQNVNLSILDGRLNSSPVSSVCVETIANENSKQEIEEASLALENYITDASIEGSKVMLKNTAFEMKAQFDLVLEELKMFHMIEVEKVETVKTQEEDRLEEACGKTKELQNGMEELSPSREVIVCSNSKDLVIIKDYRCDRKITSEVNEQEVPQPCMSSYPGDEESLYSVNNVEVIPKSLSWKPAFLNSNETELKIASYPEKAVTFSHGIGRVTPLKTRSGPLRIGLSKKAKIKQLHPYLR